VPVVVNHRRKLRRRDVVARPKKWHPRHDDANQFGQLGKIFRRRVSSAHDRSADLCFLPFHIIEMHCLHDQFIPKSKVRNDYPDLIKPVP
jgi:hypothetical protein